MIKKILGFFLALSIFVATLGGLFFFFEKKKAVDNPVKKPDKEMIYKTVKNNHNPDFPEYESFGLRPDGVTHTQMKLHGKVIYEVEYDMDKWGLRKNPEVHPGKGRSHLILAGCSFTFGQGLSVEKTISWKLEHDLPETNVYNFSFMGGAINTHLYHMKLFPLKTYVKENNGKLFYIFIHNHLSRFFARPDYLSWANGAYPHYEVQEKTPVFKGHLKDQPFFTAYKTIEKSGLKNTALHAASIVKNTDEWTDKELEEFSDAVVYLKKMYQKEFPSGEFAFVFHPNHGSRPDVVERLKKNLTKRKIDTYDAGIPFQERVKKENYNSSNYDIFGDGHPNEKMNDFFRDYIKSDVLKRPVKL